MISFEDLPSTIDGNAFAEALKELGIDIEKRPLTRLEFKSRGVYIEIDARNDEGYPMADSDYRDAKVATHTIFIPFVW